MLLDEALNLILSHSTLTGRKKIPLSDCYGRVCCHEIHAAHPRPGYDQSTRDGYAVGGAGRTFDRDHQAFSVRGEIQAGLSHVMSIGPSEAYRIMTGGLLPTGTERVIAQEYCRISGTDLVIENSMLNCPDLNIRTRGSEHPAGAQLVEAGTRLNESHLSLLAAAGNHLIEVFEKPRVAFFCSGSELVMADQEVKTGQKYSSNHLLLKSLITKFGGLAEGFGVVADERPAIKELFRTIKDSEADIVISTGGVGPGKYDLFGELLPELGARILYRSLHIRPGRSTLFGLLDDKLYFGLPGPPRRRAGSLSRTTMSIDQEDAGHEIYSQSKIGRLSGSLHFTQNSSSTLFQRRGLSTRWGTSCGWLSTGTTDTKLLNNDDAGQRYLRERRPGTAQHYPS